jgi:hypothetical protein
MDKLQKIGAWFWRNKERIVLIVMLLVLAYRVYGVMNPAPAKIWPHVPTPQTILPEAGEERQSLGLPNNPPVRPPDGLPGVYTSVYEKNPFWYYSGQKQQEGKQEVSVEDLNIQLLNIQEVDGKPRAQLHTSRTTKWYFEGESFEEFELTRIDTETQTVVVYSEKYTRQFTLKMQ